MLISLQRIKVLEILNTMHTGKISSPNILSFWIVIDTPSQTAQKIKNVTIKSLIVILTFNHTNFKSQTCICMDV